MIEPNLHDLCANTLRALAVDATNAADSGHPGAPLGMADLAVVLFGEFLRFDPNDPAWPNRDRFILSNGHASMLLYGLLHLCGYAVSIDDLRRFRQLGSKTPGHPEFGHTPGVETTTGPLGQGFANAVGMALAKRLVKKRFFSSAGELFDHKIYCFLGDGCLMEGITGEAASLAGHLALSDLIAIYDDNKISIDGPTSLTFTENVEGRFLAYGWNVLRIDGHDPNAIREAYRKARDASSQPTLIIARTHIGYGSPNKQDTADAHGSPLGEAEAGLLKAKLGWTHEPFAVPEEARRVFLTAARRGQDERRRWLDVLDAAKKADPEAFSAWDDFWQRRMDAGRLSQAVLQETGNEPTATRVASGKALNAIASRFFGLVGGSADLAASNKTLIKGAPYASRAEASRNIAYGVREHAMGAITNGLALYGGLVPYAATFLTFSDYMRPAIRLSALMKTRSLFVFTHDSVYLGEDGPTHQSVEHLWALRMIPNLYVWRPADGLETAMAWSYAVACGPSRPHALCFTRQNVPPIARAAGFDPRDVWRGGYVVADHCPPDSHRADLVILATGSEVHVAAKAAELLAKRGVFARVVSIPCLEAFLDEERDYQERIIPAAMPRVSLELGTRLAWRAITGLDGLNLGIDTFGESAPWEKLRERYRMTPELVADDVEEWSKRRT